MSKGEAPPEVMPEEPENPGEGSEEPTAKPWFSVLAIAIILVCVYLLALFLTRRGATVPPPRSSLTAVSVAEGFRPLSIAFLDETRGLVSGSFHCAACPDQRGGVIASTSDGGATWSVRSRNERPIVGLTRVGGTSHVWATATDCDNESFIGCKLLQVHSSDLGQTWRPDKPKDPFLVSPPATNRSCKVDHPYAISSSFPTPSRGWMLCAEAPTSATFQFKGLFETRTAGERWVLRAHFHPSPNGGVATGMGKMPIDGFAGGITFLESGTGWLWTTGSYSSLSTTSDSGEHWAPLWRPSEDSNRQIATASLVSRAVGYVVVRIPDAGSELLVTHDGGKSWEPVQSWRAPSQS